MLAVHLCGNAMVEGERVPSESAPWPEALRHAFERPAPIGPGGQVKEGPKGAIDEARCLVQLEVAHVALPEVKCDACRCGRRTRLVQHRGRGIDPDDGPPGRLRHGNRDAAVPDGELDERPVGLGSEAFVERDILCHRR